jgi:hypothetical protein
MVAIILRIQSLLNFFFNIVLTHHGCSQILENLPKPDPLYTGNLDKRKINFGMELFPM